MIDARALEQKLRSAREAARRLRASPRVAKDAVLEATERGLLAREAEVLAANAEDIARARAASSPPTGAFLDRLTLSAPRLKQMRAGLAAVRGEDDPVGQLVDERTLPSGVRARRVRSPLGVIYMIFESRPNVAVEAFSLAFKAGNALILRGGKESMRTTAVLYQIIGDALKTAGLPEACLWGIDDPDRALTETLLKQKQWIDLVVPRGGDGLIDYVTRTSEIPVIKNDRGLCHLYVHADADLDMAARILVNAKTQRPGVCNALETLLVNRAVAKAFLPKAHKELEKAGPVDWFGDEETLTILQGLSDIYPLEAKSFDTEYLDLKVNARVVDSLEQAIDHIERHGSRHSEAIITKDAKVARRFQDEIDAAAVYWNASTRFTDGFELGLGGELGISTQKLHVRGPVGLQELTSVRWLMDGEGQTRS